MRKVILLIALLLLGSCNRSAAPQSPAAPPPPPEPRSSVGNGSDVYSGDVASAWFLGRRNIRYCIEWASDFGMTRKEASAAVEESFKKWRDYMSRKSVNARHMPDSPAETEVDLQFNSVEQPRCDTSTDLVFHFGTEPPEVLEALRKYHRPLGFAERTHYDPRKGWGKGFVWLAGPARRFVDSSFWTMAPHWPIQAVLKHELGHVLGCGHVPGTIMRPDLAEWLVQIDKMEPSEFLNVNPVRELKEIDGRARELVSCVNCEWRSGWRGTYRLKGETASPIPILPESGTVDRVSTPFLGSWDLRFFGSGKEPEIKVKIRLSEDNLIVDGLDPVFKVSFISRKGELLSKEYHSDQLVAQGRWSMDGGFGGSLVLIRNSGKNWMQLHLGPWGLGSSTLVVEIDRR